MDKQFFLEFPDVELKIYRSEKERMTLITGRIAAKILTIETKPWREVLATDTE